MSSYVQAGTKQSSIYSQNSRFNVSLTLTDLEVLSDSELINLVNDLKKQIRLLNLENEIFENTISRLEPTLMHGVYQALEYATKRQSFASLQSGILGKSQSKYTESIASPSRMLAIPSRSSRIIDSTVMRYGPKINILEKSEIVTAEMNVMDRRLEKFKQNMAKQDALLKAQLEEIDIRVSEIEKANQVYNLKVLTEGWDVIAQRIPAEVWIKFIRNWTKVTDRQIDKLRLRTSTLNTQHAKIKGQIKFKAELSESLRPVDFDKLKIQNSECLKLIEHKQQQLTGLKELTGVANLALAVHKKAMVEQNSYLAKVLETKKVKVRRTKELYKERDLIKIQADIYAEKVDAIKKIKAAYKVPDVMDYVKIKWDVTDLNHNIKMLENRVHIQRITLTSVNKKLQSLINNWELS